MAGLLDGRMGQLLDGGEGKLYSHELIALMSSNYFVALGGKKVCGWESESYSTYFWNKTNLFGEWFSDTMNCMDISTSLLCMGYTITQSQGLIFHNRDYTRHVCLGDGYYDKIKSI